jgi:hypothetical protein
MNLPSQSGRELALGFVTLLLGAIVVWWLASAAVNFVFGLDKAVASTIVAGMVTVFGVLFAYWKDRRKADQEAHRDRKIEVYSPFFDMIFTVMRKSNDKITPDQSSDPLGQYLGSTEFFDVLYELKKRMTFYGSPEVINAMNEWLKSSGRDEDPFKQMQRVGELILAMRRDIGLSNAGLNNLSIHQMNVTEDIEAMRYKR